MPNFSEPVNPVGSYDPAYMTNLYGAAFATHWNTCIEGSPTQTGADVLSNCTGYAQGRMLRIYMEVTGFDPVTAGTHPFISLNGDAGPDWLTRAAAIGLTITAEPREGSVLVTNSHVAVVEKYDENAGLWWISESGFGDPTPWYYHNSLYQSGGIWYDSYATATEVLGFILIPGVTPGPGPSPRRRAKWIYYMKNWNNELY